MHHPVEPIARPPSLTDLAFERVRTGILTGLYPMGSLLSEQTIAQDLVISRTPIREAFGRLQSEGLVVVVPQRGTMVFTMDEARFVEICNFRAILEVGALNLAAANDPGGLAAALRVAVDNMGNAAARQDYMSYMEMDIQFHKAFFDLARNRYLDDAYRLISGQMTTLRYRVKRWSESALRGFDEHRAILTAIEEGRLADAVGILDKHTRPRDGSFWSTTEALPPAL